MRVIICDHRGNAIGSKDNVEPVCGEDFCDACGDCLSCYGGEDGCCGEEAKAHIWIVYLSEDEDSKHHAPQVER